MDKEEEIYVLHANYRRIKVPKGRQRYELITVGSWWSPKPTKDKKENPHAYRIKELIPSLPMNRVCVSRLRSPVLSINGLVNGWDPVEILPNAVLTRVREDSKKKTTAEKIEEAVHEALIPLRAEIQEIRNDLNRLLDNLGVDH